MARNEEPFLGQLAIEKKFITLAQLDECLRLQKRMHPPRRIGEILVSKNYLSPEQLDDLLSIQKKQPGREELLDIDDESLERNLLVKGITSKKHIREAKRIQGLMREKGKIVSLAEVMLDKNFISITQLRRLRSSVNRKSEEALEEFPEIEGYEIIRKIRKGGMGTVYMARQLSMDRVIALKILAPELADDKTYIERFFTEAKAVAKLNHKNIMSGIDVGQSNSYYYFVMEYINGETILEIMRKKQKKNEKIALPFALKVVHQVAQALAHAAEHGIIHRDIKPGNIMINHQGVIKLCDLGFAKTSNIDLLTKEGTTLGTPYYMSPEQCRGLQDIDIRSDIYSLGATLYHTLIGKVPFTGRTASEILKKHLVEDLVIPQESRAELGEHVCHIIEKMMAKDRNQRHENPHELLDELEPLLARFEAPTILILYHTCYSANDLALFIAEGAYVEGIKVEVIKAEDVTSDHLRSAGAIIIGSYASGENIPNDIKAILEIMDRFRKDMKGKLGAAFLAYDPQNKNSKAQGYRQLSKILFKLLNMELMVRGCFSDSFVGGKPVDDPEGEDAEKYRHLGHEFATTLLKMVAGARAMRES